MTGDFEWIGADTANGYEHFIADWRPAGRDARVCVVRGAIGVGRHRLLNALAEDWTRQGRAVTRFAGTDGPERAAAVLCGDWAVFDGAAMRGLDAEPGDLEIDLSAAIDQYALRGERARAGALYRRMHGLRARAWRCMQVARTAWSDSAAIYAEAVDGGAAMNLRLALSRWMQGAEGNRRRMFAQAVTADGVLSRAGGLTRPQTLCLDLPWGFDPDSLLYPVAAGLGLRGAGYTASMQALDGGRLAHLRTNSHAILSHAEPEYETRSLPFDEAVLRRERDALAFNRAAYDLWLRQASDALAGARACRESLERLVGDAVIPKAWNELAEKAVSFFKNS